MLQFNQLSYWEKETNLTKLDYLIIGSGIVGLSAAIHLKQEQPDKKVTIIERGYFPSGASTKNAGFACVGSASELLDDLSRSSESTVFQTVQERWEGLKALTDLLGEEAIGYQALGSHELFKLAERQQHEKCLDQLTYLNGRMYEITGIKTVYSAADSVIEGSGYKGFKGAISNAAEGQIDTGKMMQTLTALAQFHGVKILNGIEVNSIEKQKVNTNYGSINFNKVAICTNGIAAQFMPDEDIKPARAQVVVTSPIANLKVKGTYHFDKGYYYFRNIGNRVLFGGGRNQDFEAEETDELNTSDMIINHLSHILETQILPNSAFTIEHQWAGTMGIGEQKVPIIKQLDEHLFCGVRLGGMGVAIGTLVGKKLASLMN